MKGMVESQSVKGQMREFYEQGDLSWQERFAMSMAAQESANRESEAIDALRKQFGAEKVAAASEGLRRNGVENPTASDVGAVFEHHAASLSAGSGAKPGGGHKF